MEHAHQPRCGLWRAQASTQPITTDDDAHFLEPLLDELEHEGLCINLNGRIHREEGLVFCGMNRVRDYPFGYKHWCAYDGDYIACPIQFCGEGQEMNEHGEFVPIDNLLAYLTAKPSIGEELDRLRAQLRLGEMERSIWMVHQPPTGLGMDICGDGRQVGSPTVLKFIKDNQPLLGCSGHIHESPISARRPVDGAGGPDELVSARPDGVPVALRLRGTGRWS